MFSLTSIIKQQKIEQQINCNSNSSSNKVWTIFNINCVWQQFSELFYSVTKKEEKVVQERLKKYNLIYQIEKKKPMWKFRNIQWFQFILTIQLVDKANAADISDTSRQNNINSNDSSANTSQTLRSNNNEEPHAQKAIKNKTKEKTENNNKWKRLGLKNETLEVLTTVLQWKPADINGFFTIQEDADIFKYLSTDMQVSTMLCKMDE